MKVEKELTQAQMISEIMRTLGFSSKDVADALTGTISVSTPIGRGVYDEYLQNMVAKFESRFSGTRVYHVLEYNMELSGQFIHCIDFLIFTDEGDYPDKMEDQEEEIAGAIHGWVSGYANGICSELGRIRVNKEKDGKGNIYLQRIG